MMEGSALAQWLGEIMDVLFDIRNEVNNYGEDIETLV